MTKLKIGDEWWTAPTESENGRTIIVTGRRGLEPAIESGKYNDRIEITWKYPASADGMPDPATSTLIGKVSDALAETFAQNQTILITGIYTGDGERNWVCYTKNVEQFQLKLNEALKDFELLPLTIYAEKDPEWNEYLEMKELTEIAEGS